MEWFLVAFILIHSICFCYQQDINVCPIGTDYFNGNCIRSRCPETHYFVNGACLLRPSSQETASCGYGFDLINGMCVQQNCPINFIMINGLCQERVYNPPPSLYCPSGFSIQNEICFPNPGIIPPQFCQPKPCRTFRCPFTCDESRTTTTTTTTKPTTTTTPEPDICPPEHVIIDGECRIVSCYKGTFYKGRCLEPVCAHGLVWTGLKCTQPEVITTILEIQNNFITELNETGPEFHATKSVDNVIYRTETEIVTNETTADPSGCTPETLNSNKKCCIIITPRMCKKYSSKWVCFNRQYRRCGEVCGTNSIIYLKVPKVIDNSGMLVIPPNPELQECFGNECKISDAIDCSGCPIKQKQTCSPYCYRYRCRNRCTYIEQNEYCTKYKGSPGCSSMDGCFENYCYEEISSRPQEC